MFIHCHQWFWSAQTVKSNSLAGCMFSHSHQWFWSAQTPESDSQAEYMFSHSHQWFWSAQALGSDSQSGHVFSHSCQWSKTREQLTSWIDIQPLHDSDLIKHRKVTHKLGAHPAIPISGFDLLKHCIATHSLDAWFLLHSDLINDWKDSLAGCMFSLLSSSDPLKHWVTHSIHTLDMGQSFSLVVLTCSNTGKRLTS